jgi:hypothetical protein
MARKDKAGVRVRRLGLRYALPRSDQDRGQTIIATVRRGFCHMRPLRTLPPKEGEEGAAADREEVVRGTLESVAAGI